MFAKNKPFATPVFLRQCPHCTEMTKLKKEHCVHCGYPLPYLKPTQMQVLFSSSTIKPFNASSKRRKNLHVWRLLDISQHFFIGVMCLLLFGFFAYSGSNSLFELFLLGLTIIFLGIGTMRMGQYYEEIYWIPYRIKRNLRKPKQTKNLRIFWAGFWMIIAGIFLLAVVIIPLIIPAQILIGILVFAILIAGIFLLHLIYKTHVKTT